jgi:predicted ribosome quality control (RQC) complex YloA/Tae2 family protein
VLVGRGDAENDHLTFRVASQRDWWLHAGGGTPGSHVVIRNPDRMEAPLDIIKQAAQLAAWYSKARAASRVEVHYCRVSEVSKRRGAPKGEVMLRKFKKLKVVPSRLDESDDD